MAVLWWLIPALAATLLATAWVAWASRTRRPADTHETLDDYERFKAAMERDPRRGRTGRRDGQPDRPGASEPRR